MTKKTSANWTKALFLGEKNGKSHHILRKKSHWPSSTRRFTHIFVMSYKKIKTYLKKSFYILTKCWEQCVEKHGNFFRNVF
jgi:hypothetical protein